MDAVLQHIFDAILDGSTGKVPGLVQQALDAGIQPDAILNQAMIGAMTEVGRLFEEGEYFIPEMLVSARAMQAGLTVLKPRLASASLTSSGVVVAGTVKGDMHDIGKNLVCMMLEGAAFQIIDLGADVAPEKFVEAVRSSDAQIVAMSALLTTTMPGMRTTIQALQEAGLRDQVKVLVGGAPVTQAFADSIGADGYAPDASRAVAKAKELLSK